MTGGGGGNYEKNKQNWASKYNWQEFWKTDNLGRGSGTEKSGILRLDINVSRECLGRVGYQGFRGPFPGISELFPPLLQHTRYIRWLSLSG